MIRPPYDGWVDHQSARKAEDEDLGTLVSEGDALRSLAAFRGEVLAAAYALENSLETLILWHLFRNRDDGMAAFFEDQVLRENGFGLERKIRLVYAIIDHWSDDEIQAQEDKRRLDRARQTRNQIAHWPARLIPVVKDGNVVGYDVALVRGNRAIDINASARRQLMVDFEDAKSRLQELSRELSEFARYDAL